MPYRALAVILAAQALAAQQPGASERAIRIAPTHTIAELPGVEIAEVIPSGSPNRLYYTVGDSLYVFDVPTKKSTLVLAGEAWNVDVSPKNDRLVFARGTEAGKLSNVWMLPLDARTGLATAPARRLALTVGDQPRVSPDGKFVAYAAYDSSDSEATQHLAIVPADGGTDRVVARTAGGIGRIQWTPDGRTLYFASNRLGVPGWKLLRVSAAGGQTDTISIAFVKGVPGLSPDGNLIAVAQTPSRGYVVADTRGTPVSRFSLLAPIELTGWAGLSWNGARSLLARGVLRKNAVRIVSLDNGAAREIVSAESESELPFWSPDGKSIATFAKSNGKRVLLVIDANNARRREFTTGIEQNCCVAGGRQNLQWSPDGRYIAFHSGSEGPGLRVLEVATGAVRPLGAQGSVVGQYHWRSNSRGIMYTELPSDNVLNRRVEVGDHRRIHEITLDGKDRVLLDNLPALGGPLGMRNDSTGVFLSDSGVFLIPLNGKSWTRLSAYRSAAAPSDPQLTRFALRQAKSGATHHLDIVDATGKQQTELNIQAFPFWSPIFHPDGKRLILDGIVGDHHAIFITEVTGTMPRKLMDLPNKTQPQMDLSPDGKQLVVTVDGPSTSMIVQVDLSSLVPATRPPQR